MSFLPELRLLHGVFGPRVRCIIGHLGWHATEHIPAEATVERFRTLSLNYFMDICCRWKLRDAAARRRNLLSRFYQVVWVRDDALHQRIYSSADSQLAEVHRTSVVVIL